MRIIRNTILNNTPWFDFVLQPGMVDWIAIAE